MSSNSFLSDLSNVLRNGFQSAFSIASTILDEGMVLPIYFTATAIVLILDNDVVERLLKAKQGQRGEAIHIEDTPRLVTEIEMLKVVSYLVSRREEEQ
jgi:hypothetical protein